MILQRIKVNCLERMLHSELMMLQLMELMVQRIKVKC